LPDVSQPFIQHRIQSLITKRLFVVLIVAYGLLIESTCSRLPAPFQRLDQAMRVERFLRSLYNDAKAVASASARVVWSSNADEHNRNRRVQTERRRRIRFPTCPEVDVENETDSAVGGVAHRNSSADENETVA
jgi:hypothetical protein